MDLRTISETLRVHVIADNKVIFREISHSIVVPLQKLDSIQTELTKAINRMVGV